MAKESDFGVIRDSVNAVNKYCRIPIQRKRTPICEKEISELEKLRAGLEANLDILGRMACLLSDLGFPHFAGKIFSYIDMESGKDYKFVEFEKSEV